MVLALCRRGVVGLVHLGVLDVTHLPVNAKAACAAFVVLACLLAGGNACGLDVAEFPSNQNTEKQQDRETDPHRQSFDHLARFGLAIAAITHHEDQSRDQAPQNGHKGNSNNEFHTLDYRHAAGPPCGVGDACHVRRCGVDGASGILASLACRGKTTTP